jgi:hypothetical protein
VLDQLRVLVERVLEPEHGDDQPRSAVQETELEEVGLEEGPPARRNAFAKLGGGAGSLLLSTPSDE